MISTSKGPACGVRAAPRLVVFLMHRRAGLLRVCEMSGNVTGPLPGDIKYNTFCTPSTPCPQKNCEERSEKVLDAR